MLSALMIMLLMGILGVFAFGAVFVLLAVAAAALLGGLVFSWKVLPFAAAVWVALRLLRSRAHTSRITAADRAWLDSTERHDR